MDVTSFLLGKKQGGGGGSNYQSKSVQITENGTTDIRPDTGYDALSKVNVTVSGILDTSDANAIASDMAIGKTAYVNGSKITGDVPIGSSSVSTNYAGTNVDTYLDDLQVDTEQTIKNQMFKVGDKISVYAPLTDVAQAVGASAEKIKKDEVICGVTGTYEGSGGGADEYFNSSISAGDNTWPGFLYTIKALPLLPISGTSTYYMFRSFQGTELPLYDFSNVTTAHYTFVQCPNLTTIPQYDFSNATNIKSMFFGTPNLTDTSLDNILKMCINMTSYTGTKTLAEMGLNRDTSGKYPASRIQALPSYQDFLDAGWTIGY